MMAFFAPRENWFKKTHFSTNTNRPPLPRRLPACSPQKKREKDSRFWAGVAVSATPHVWTLGRPNSLFVRQDASIFSVTHQLPVKQTANRLSRLAIFALNLCAIIFQGTVFDYWTSDRRPASARSGSCARMGLGSPASCRKCTAAMHQIPGHTDRIFPQVSPG